MSPEDEGDGRADGDERGGDRRTAAGDEAGVAGDERTGDDEPWANGDEPGADSDERAGDDEPRPAADSDTPSGESTAVDLFTPADDRLLLDAMLGKLATYLRLCGYDAAYVESDAGAGDIGQEGYEDIDVDGEPGDRETAIRQWAVEESRTLVTRDRSLGTTTPGAILLSSRDVDAQLAELAQAGFALRLPDSPARCATCNAALESVGAEEPTPDYAPDAATTDVWRCPACGQFYWRGSHWDDVADTLAGVR